MQKKNEARDEKIADKAEAEKGKKFFITMDLQAVLLSMGVHNRTGTAH